VTTPRRSITTLKNKNGSMPVLLWTVHLRTVHLLKFISRQFISSQFKSSQFIFDISSQSSFPDSSIPKIHFETFFLLPINLQYFISNNLSWPLILYETETFSSMRQFISGQFIPDSSFSTAHLHIIHPRQ
jgi:hypothetical protein